MIKRRSVLANAAVPLAAALGVPALAEAPYPNRPLRLIVPWAAGGSTDSICRTFAEDLRPLLGQPVVVENRPGGSSAVGMTALKGAAPDGYTIGQAPITMFRAALMERVAFDPLRDFGYLMGAAVQVAILAVRADSPHKSLAELLAAARANPGKLNYGSTGNASGGRLYTDELLRSASVQVQHIPFGGSAPLQTALLGGQIDFALDTGSIGPLAEAGKVRLLVVYGNKRLGTFPAVPTLKDLGFDIPVGGQYGFVLPAGVEPAVVDRLHRAFKQAWQSPSVQARFFVYNEIPSYLSPSDYAASAPRLMMQERAVIERAGLLRANS